jgi:hypothetical protein
MCEGLSLKTSSRVLSYTWQLTCYRPSCDNEIRSLCEISEAFVFISVKILRYETRAWISMLTAVITSYLDA